MCCSLLKRQQQNQVRSSALFFFFSICKCSLNSKHLKLPQPTCFVGSYCSNWRLAKPNPGFQERTSCKPHHGQNLQGERLEILSFPKPDILHFNRLRRRVSESTAEESIAGEGTPLPKSQPAAYIAQIEIGVARLRRLRSKRYFEPKAG